jgi:very-short-patch-repair endonuclease
LNLDVGPRSSLVLAERHTKPRRLSETWRAVRLLYPEASATISWCPIPDDSCGGYSNPEPAALDEETTLKRKIRGILLEKRRRLRKDARRLRRQPTAAQRVLWERLRAKRQGLKFRREHAFDLGIADFYCVPARLIVEVDGPIHSSKAEADRLRDRKFGARKIRTLRFSNDEVEKNLDDVLLRIQFGIGETLADEMENAT